MKKLKFQGTGIESASELIDDGILNDHVSQMEVVEIIPECFFDGRRQSYLDLLAKHQIPVIGHGVELSVGSTDFNQSHLDKTKKVLSQVNTVAFSDHLCFTRNGGINIGQLTTLPFNQEALDTVCENIDRIQQQLPLPFLIENITNRFIVPECEFEETEFINKVTDNTDCGLLLDVTNLYTNSVNHRFDPLQWLAEIAPQRIQGIHLAGGEWEDGYLYDAHNSKVPEEVWQLYAKVLEVSQPAVTIIEWDLDCPPWKVLAAEIQKAKTIQQQNQKQGVAYVSR